jgi:nitric oxide reductase activation protein
LTDYLIVGELVGCRLMYDKTAEGVVYTLNANGEVTRWTEPKYEAQVLYLEGTDADICQWLTDTRNKHLYLTRATGWHLYVKFTEVPDRPNTWCGVARWDNDAENQARMAAYDAEHGTDYAGLTFYGPLMDLGHTFLHWKKKYLAWKEREQVAAEATRLMEAKAHADLTAAEDEECFAAITRSAGMEA